jgi:Gpi18-like mannosyltransferase
MLLVVAAIFVPIVFKLPFNPIGWSGSSEAWINSWARWDAEWYTTIAEHGYTYVPGAASNVAFSPLLPALMKVGSVALGRDDVDGWLLGGLIASNLALVVGIAYLVRLLRLDFDILVARRAALSVLVFPTSLFLSAVYPESLYLAFSVAAFYYARRQNWWLAGALGAAGTLARPHGILIIVPLAYEYMAQRKFSLRSIRRDLLALGLIAAAFVGWAMYLFDISGIPLLVLHAGAPWNRQLTPPWQVLQTFFSQPLVVHSYSHSPLDLLFALAFLVLTIATWWMVRTSYAVYTTLLFSIMVSSGLLTSIMRYELVLFPAFAVLGAAMRNRRFRYAYVIASLGLGVVFMEVFARGFWVA